MQYILLIYGDETAGTAMSPEDQGKRLQAWDDYTQWLKDKNYYVGGDALHPTRDATTVRVRDGQTITTDGPFAEAKEFLAGFWIVDVERVERVYAIAATISAAPGKGGAPMNMPIEVRQVMSRPPEDL